MARRVIDGTADNTGRRIQAKPRRQIPTDAVSADGVTGITGTEVARQVNADARFTIRITLIWYPAAADGGIIVCAIDGDGDSRGTGVAIGVCDDIAEGIRQSGAVIEALDAGVAVVERIGVCTI